MIVRISKFLFFPTLRHLTLIDLHSVADGIIRGADSPCLETIIVRNCGSGFGLTGHFPALSSLSLIMITLSMDVAFEAPCLSSISLLGVENANRLLLSRKAFPELQSIGAFSSFFREDLPENVGTFLPKLGMEPIAVGCASVTVFLDYRASFKWSAVMPLGWILFKANPPSRQEFDLR